MTAAKKKAIRVQLKIQNDCNDERMFFDECLLEDPTGEGMSPKSLYAGYGRWCKVAGHSAKAKINFGKRLTDLGTESLRGHSGKRWLVKPSPASSAIWDRIEV
jgi:phage/plasmid-associated DNA primase